MSSMSKQCPRLSVAIIARDVEDCLASTLDSVRNLADEIVVLDTGSRDSTIRIARQKATTLVTRAWNDDFSAARNAAMEAATGDWVLWLDAGETLSPAAVEGLRKFVDHDIDDNSAYYLLVSTPAQGTNIAGEQIARLRLHRRVDGIRFQGRVRESLAGSLQEHSIHTAALSWRIERSAREHDDKLRRSRAERNLRLAGLALEEEGTSARLLNCLGEAAQALGDNGASIGWYRQALVLSASPTPDTLEAYYGILTALEGQDASREAQLQLCMKALEIFPLDTQLLCAIGGYLQSREQLELASRAYHLAAHYGQITPEIWHLVGLQEIAMNCYALTLQHLGREEEARQLLERELAAQPAAARLRRQLLELHVRHGCRDEALAVVNSMPRDVPNREALRSAVRGASLAAAGNWISARSYLETAYKAGCREPLCLRWLTAAYLAASRNEDAQQMLSEWSRVDPHSPELQQYRQAMVQPARAAVDRTLRVDESETLSGIPAPAIPLGSTASRAPA